MGYKVLIPFLALSSILFLFNVILSALAGATEGVIFNSQTGKISDKYPTYITPTGWTFMIWNVIFVLIGASLVFLIIATVQHAKRRSAHNPVVFTAPTAAVFLVNQILYITWLFVWDNEKLMAAAVILAVMMVTNWITVVLLGISLKNSTEDLSLGKSTTKLWTYRLLVQNAFATYTAWTTIAALVNFGIAFIHGGTGEDNKGTSFVNLGILTFLVILWFALDVFLFDALFRYMIAPLLVVVWAMTGILFKHWSLPDPERHNINDLTIFVYVLLGLSSVLAVARIAISMYRHLRQPV